MKTFSELAECLARILPKLTLYRLLFKYNYVGCLLLLMFSSDLLFAIKREAYIFKKTGWFCRFPKPQKLDKSGRWLEKKSKQACPNFTLKPNTKARSLQFCKTEIKTDIGGEKKRNKRRIYGLLVNGMDLRHYAKQPSRERVKDSFTRLFHSCQCHCIHIYIYTCMSVFTTSFGSY